MAEIIDLGSAAKDDPIYSDGLQMHSHPESAPSTDEAPPQAVTSPSAPAAAPPVSPASPLSRRRVCGTPALVETWDEVMSNSSPVSET